MKVIQVGLGRFGRYWVNYLRDSAYADLVALVDMDEQALQAAVKGRGAKAEATYTDLEEALEQSAAEVALIVTPPSVHCPHVVAAMQHGLDVICEKPLALNMSDARAMARMAEETGRLMLVSQNYRYRAVTETLRRQIANNEIGQIGQLRIDFLKGWPFDEDDFRIKMDHPLLADMAIHHFDLMRFVTGLEAVSVHGEAWNPPWSTNAGDTSASLLFTLQNGARFAYHASWCAQGDFSDWNGNWHIDGDQGSLRYEECTITLTHTDKRHKALRELIVPPVTLRTEGQEAILMAMAEARNTGEQPATSVFDNLHSLAMVRAAIEAVDSGREVAVETV